MLTGSEPAKRKARNSWNSQTTSPAATTALATVAANGRRGAPLAEPRHEREQHERHRVEAVALDHPVGGARRERADLDATSTTPATATATICALRVALRVRPSTAWISSTRSAANGATPAASESSPRWRIAQRATSRHGYDVVPQVGVRTERREVRARRDALVEQVRSHASTSSAPTARAWSSARRRNSRRGDACAPVEDEREHGRGDEHRREHDALVARRPGEHDQRERERLVAEASAARARARSRRRRRRMSGRRRSRS